MTLLLDKPIKWLAYASLGFLTRILLMRTSKETLRHRVEIVTPVSDWKRAYEAIHLWNSGLDPYDGNIFHEYPISLQFYKMVSSCLDVDLVFVSTDILTALLLLESIYRQLIRDNEGKEEAEKRSKLVFLFYLFSPLTIISCAGQSTVIFTNFLIALILYTLSIRTFRALTCVLCALLACNNIYFSTLILPIFVCMEYSSRDRKKIGNVDKDSIKTTSTSSETRPTTHLRNSNHRERDDVKTKDTYEMGSIHYYSEANFSSSLANSAIICLVSIIAILVTSYILMGNSLHFIYASYLFTLKVEDLTPNIGIYWYFFTEMFGHFLPFFTCVVQILSFIQVIPLTVILRDRPYFALYIIALVSTICQPYPSLANIGLLTSILPQYLDLFNHLYQGLKVLCTCITCLCLWPIFWHLWIVMGTANANFYFGATLAFMAALIFFTVDLLNAHVYKMTKIKLDEIEERKAQSKIK